MKKLKTLSQLQKIISQERRKGRKIVLANGGFDLIHAGHIRYLKEAKRKGDFLVVALNSDASVRRLKGKGRPILPARERAEILSSFSDVDYLILFDEPTVEKILLSLKPDVHAKGSDYTRKTVPERETVLSYGGRIAIVGGPKIRSASQVMHRIAAKIKTSNSGKN
ncbi:MAG: adenylyltransferase/cytidyltransferase family protein [Candidatus Aminicenantales bacterium]